MQTDLSYREWSPPPGLRATVKGVWSLRGHADPDARGQPIVPDGCPEIVFNLADPFVRDQGGRRSLQPSALWVGPTTRPTVVAPSGRCELIGIRLHPWGGSALLGAPMADVRDALVPASDVLGAWATTLLDRLADTPDAGRVDAALEAIRLRVPTPPTRSASVAAAVVHRIVADGGRVTVKGIARGLHVSDRTVQRALRHDVGLPPAVLARILRFQGALARLLIDPDVLLVRVALDAGYYDQAHFNREFRRLVGCSPTAFLKRERSLTEPFVSELPDRG